MQWYYSANGTQQGPISTAELETLVASGTIKAETLVWRDGLPNWAPYSTVGTPVSTNGLVAGATEAGGIFARCAECGQNYPKNDMVRFENAHVCVNCKPRFFQKLREGVSTGGAGFWRYKKQLVTSLNPVLPMRCVKCNTPTTTPLLKRNLSWHHPLVFVALLFNVIIYIIVAMCVRKRSTAMISVCQEHRTKRRNAILVAWLLVLLGIASFVAGLANDIAWVAIAGVVLFLAGIVYGLVRGRLVIAAKIDKERMWLNGCSKEFLAEFPEWTGS